MERLKYARKEASRYLEEPKRYKDKGTFFGKIKGKDEFGYLRIGRIKGEGSSVRSISHKSSNPEPLRVHSYGNPKTIKAISKKGKIVLLVRRK